MAHDDDPQGQHSGRVAEATDDETEPSTVTSAHLATLFATHGAELRRFVLGVLRDPDLTGDVVQATFLKALEQSHTARLETLKGWLFRIAFHEALLVRRRHATREKGVRRLADLWHHRQTESRPEETLIRQEAAENLHRLMDELPEPQQRVLRERLYEDKTFAEIARESGLPLGTVLTRMRLALEKLRHALRPED